MIDKKMMNKRLFSEPFPWIQQARGKQSRIAGQIFEKQIEKSLEWYEARGWLRVIKTPEPMKPIKSPNSRGQFMACHTKPAQVDFCGTLSGGRAIRFEAKQTDTTRFTRDRLTIEQIADLRESEALGAYCCVMICFGFDRFYRIPWIIWDNMKLAFGRLYITEDDVKGFRLPSEGEIIKILADTEEEPLESLTMKWSETKWT